MASSINASITSSGIVQTADASGNLVLQGNGTTGLTIDNTGKVLLPNIALAGTASAGMLEYNGTAPYFTPLGTQRGVIPGMQYYRLNTDLIGANATGAQNIFGVGCTVSSSTVYEFETVFVLTKTAGTTSHTISLGFGGTATTSNIGYLSINQSGTLQTDVPYAGTQFTKWIITSSADAVTTGITAAGQYRWFNLKGTVSINAGGTFIPQYTLSVAPGGAYTTVTGGYFKIYPIGAAGSNINVGTWA